MPSGQPSPGSGDRDFDAAFEDIVARWGEAPVEPDRPSRVNRPPHVDRAQRLGPAEPTAEDPADAPTPAPSRQAHGDRADVSSHAGPTDRTPEPVFGPLRHDRSRDRAHDHERARADVPPEGPAGTRQASGVVVPPRPAEGQQQEHFGHRGYTPADVPEEAFEPPAPAPVPAPDKDPVFWTIIGCLVGGPLLLILLVLSSRTSMTLLVGLGVVATCVGFVLLVLRGRNEPRDPYDDGARL